MNFQHLFTGLAAGLLASSALAQTGPVNWEKSLSYHLDQGYSQQHFGTEASVVFVDPVTSGTTTSAMVDGIYLGRGHGDSITSTYHETKSIPTSLNLLVKPEDYVTHTIRFDKLLSGGSLSEFGSLQNDHIITISGGNTVLFNRDVVLTSADGGSISSTDWAILGNGTSQMHFLSLGVTDSWAYGFNGAEGLQISGTWNTLSITQFNNTLSSSGAAYDSQAGFRITEAYVVQEIPPIPEPSSAFLAGSVGVLLLLRRRRNC